MSKLAEVYDRSRVPLYIQVASVMRQRIETGHWLPGDKISTLEELEAEFSVARVTVRQAVEMLREEQLLEAHQGRGTFVTKTIENNRWLNLATDFQSLVSSIRDNVLKRVHIDDAMPAPELHAGEGKLADRYTFLRSVQYNKGQPFSVVNLHLAQHIFDRDPALFKHSAALPKMVEMEGVVITHAHQTLTIGVADPQTANLLKIGLGGPTADCRLVVVDDQDVAIYVADIHYRSNCFTLRMDLLQPGPVVPAAKPAARRRADRLIEVL